MIELRDAQCLAGTCDVHEEQDWAEMLMDLAMTLARHRVMTCGQYMWNMPGAFVLALSDDVLDHLALLQWLADCWHAWQSLLESGFAATRWWASFIARSPLQHQMVRTFIRQGLTNFSWSLMTFNSV